ncbi:MAG: YggT family protein [Chloroflexi bacterium]|nr:YggT family protein [Chloroflexota bacterium]
MSIIIYLVNLIFTLLIFAIIARAILSWFPQDPYNPNPLIVWLHRITDPILEPIHRLIPPIGAIDISPIIALIGLQILQAIVDTLLRSMVR